MKIENINIEDVEYFIAKYKRDQENNKKDLIRASILLSGLVAIQEVENDTLNEYYTK